jgi:hypothetical protein
MPSTEVDDMRPYMAAKLKAISGRSGKVLYSAARTLTKGHCYLLGFNPGGDPDRYKRHTIARSLKELPAKTSNDYLCEKWPFRNGPLLPEGCHPIQKHVQEVIALFGCDVSDICASNIIFVRSRDSRKIKREWRYLAETCWAFHGRVLEIVKPKVILVYGKSTFEFVQGKLQAELDPMVHYGKIRVARREATKVVGLPHLSRFTVRNKDDIGDFLRKLWNA